MSIMNHFRIYLQTFMDGKPWIYLPAIRFCHPNKDSVNSNTDIVIDGYPRSANTFAYRAFVESQKEEYKICHHFHSPNQILLAAKWRIPTILLIRKPRDAVLSLIARKPSISVCPALMRYISFYTTSLELKDSVVVGHFDEVTSDYGRVMKRVNCRYGTSFTPFRHTAENEEYIFKIIKSYNQKFENGRLNKIAIPSEQKESIKEDLERRFKSEEINDLLQLADAVYSRYC